VLKYITFLGYLVATTTSEAKIRGASDRWQASPPEERWVRARADVGEDRRRVGYLEGGPGDWAST
jgi:hypothetical protein